MGVGSVTAICAVVIAVLSLGVSIIEARAAREHNRQSVRPLLQFTREHTSGHAWAGLVLENVGLGPAIVTGSIVRLDGTDIGNWDHRAVDLIVGPHRPRPSYTVVRTGRVLPAGASIRPIFLEDFDTTRDEWFWETLVRRIYVEVRYESIYGGKQISAIARPRHEILADADDGRGQAAVPAPHAATADRGNPRPPSLGARLRRLSRGLRMPQARLRYEARCPRRWRRRCPASYVEGLTSRGSDAVSDHGRVIDLLDWRSNTRRAAVRAAWVRMPHVNELAERVPPL